MRVAIVTALGIITLLIGCKKAEAPPDPPVSKATSTAEVVAAAPTTRQQDGFDINQYPMSDVALPAFPYFSLPEGYTNQGYGRFTKDFARFPFWVNGNAHWVEGKFYGTTFAPVQGKEFSEYEFKRNFEALVKQMGGEKVSEGRIPGEEVRSWGDEITMGFVDGLGDIYNNPATTYLVRHPGGNIWLHLVTTSAGGKYIVGHEEALQPTATLLVASDLKKEIDGTGKVALQVNFATDKTDILPDSMPQIAQVVQLLKDDTGLQLSVNGHTDNTGDAQHNQQLSEGRAKAVVAALVAQGVDAERLQARGFGDSQPVGDNGSETGKAQNRRVELVRR